MYQKYKKSGWKFLKTIGIPIIALYLILIVLLLNFQEKLIFQSDSLPLDYEFVSEVPFDELFLKADDEAVIHGLHFARENPKGVLLYFHGNARSLAYWSDWAMQLSTRFNYDVVIMDYRGYGKSGGKRSYLKMLDDGLLFYDYCLTHFSKDEITIFGRSLGGAFASHIAKQKEAKQLILEATFTSIYDIAKSRFWFLPLKWLLKYPFQNAVNVTEITMPTYFIHGTEDNIVPFIHSQKLLDNSASTNKELFTIEGAQHNNTLAFPSYFEALETILQ